MREELVLVTGGVRSGKSRKALAIATNAPRTLVATAVPGDEEMRERIAAHRRERGADFDTVEEPLDVARVLLERPDGDLVVDCMTLWLANVLETGAGAEDAARRVDELVEAARPRRGATIWVTNEVGMGIVPPYPSGRVFRDAAGAMNQALARASGRVLLMVAGLELRLK
jgi:adenosylcobinamide kinase/adenosylcobinamide-phosphate guanylyltransferase